MMCAVRSLVSWTSSRRRWDASAQSALGIPSGVSSSDDRILSALTRSCVEDCCMLFLFVDYDSVAFFVGEFD
jgi:hypothetical protein